MTCRLDLSDMNWSVIRCKSGKEDPSRRFAHASAVVPGGLHGEGRLLIHGGWAFEHEVPSEDVDASIFLSDCRVRSSLSSYLGTSCL